MTHRGFREGVRSPLVLIAWLILGGCSSSSKVPATPKCFLASDCQNLLQCVQGYCVKACAQSRDCPNGERCITAAEGNTCQPLETATCQYNSQCTKPLVCAFDQKCRDQCQQNIDCPTGQMCTSITHLCADPTIDKNYDPATNEFVATNDGGTGGAGGGTSGGTGGVGGAVTGTGGAAGSSGAPSGVAINVSSLGTAFNYTQGSYLIGFKFRVNSAITVTDLGFWDSNLTGAAETFVPVPVGLYDLSTNTLLGFAAVQASDPATGFFRYASLATPIAINTTDSYAVVGVSGTNNYAVGVGSCSGGFACSQATMNTAVTFLGGACLGAQCLTTTNTLAEPTDFEIWANFGANFIFATGSGGSDAGIDAAVANPGDSGAGGGSGGGDAGVDAPVTNPGDSGPGAGGTGGSSGGAGGSSKRDAGIAGASGTTCAPGQTPTKFRFPATSDSNPNYTSGVGVLTATELLAFNAYAGPGSADGGLVNRIDVQHFDPSTGASKGPAAPLLTAAGDGSGIVINGAAVAPTGEIAIIYSAPISGWGGAYLVFLDKNLAPVQTTLFVVVGSEYYHNQSYVQWLNGQFVASDVFNNQTIKLGRFGTDGSNLGITRAVPTDDPAAAVDPWSPSSGEVAFSGSTFAVAFHSAANGGYPLLTFVDALDPLSAEVASPVALPSANTDSPVAVAGTSQGFVAVYNGTSSSKTNSLLATYVSNSPSGDAGVPVGATYAFLGGYVYNSAWSTRGSSDGTGAGFAALYPDGSVSFLYFSGDGSMHGNPQTVLQQTNTASDRDEAHLTSFAGKFAVSLYSSGEHLTRVITSTCQ